MDMYREEILEHWQNPQNFGVIDDADLVIEQVNPLCGDEVTFYFKFGRGPVSEIGPAARHPRPTSSLQTKLEIKSNSRSAAAGARRGFPTRVTHFEARMANSEWRIIDVKFTGSGCAISIASASILSENIRNKKISTLSKITGEDVLKLIGGPVAPARLKCAFLALEALRQAQGKLVRKSDNY